MSGEHEAPAFDADQEEGEGWESSNVSPRSVIAPASRGIVRNGVSTNWKGKVPDPPKPLVEESFSFYEDRSPHKPERKYSVSPPRTRQTTSDGYGSDVVVAFDGLTVMTPALNRRAILWQDQQRPPSVPFDNKSRVLDRGSHYIPHTVDVGRGGSAGDPAQHPEGLSKVPSQRQRDWCEGQERGIPCDKRGLMLIQVAPGIKAPLRGSDETWEAIQQDFYVPGMCLSCDMTLFVIQDAAYVLCPDCHCVNAMEGDFVDRIAAGVGLGFKYDDLMKWQLEILQEQKRSRKASTHGRNRH